MFSNFSEESQKVLQCAKREMKELRHPYVGTEHLLLGILSCDYLDITNILKKYSITYDLFKNELIRVVGYGKKSNQWYLFTPLLKKVLEFSIYDAKENNEKEISVFRIFLSLISEGDGVAIRLLVGLNIDLEDLYNDLINLVSKRKTNAKKKMFLDLFGVDLNSELDNDTTIVERDKEINYVIEVLGRKTKNNPLLIGDAGVGKTAVVEELARRIRTNTVPDFLKNKKIISLSMSSLVAGTKYRGEFEERINKLLKEVQSNEEIILFIDEIHTLVGAGGAEGAIDASNILKPSLSRGKLHLIGATTYSEYVSYIEKDKALDRRFQKIYINEPDVSQTKNILYKVKNSYEKFHNIKINDNLLSYIVEMSNKYIHDRYQPDKSIDILDEVCVKACLNFSLSGDLKNNLNSDLSKIVKDKNTAIINHNFDEALLLREKEFKLRKKINLLKIPLNRNVIITKDMINEVIFNKTKIPIYNYSDYESIKNKILNLNSLVIGQEHVVCELAACYKRKITNSIPKVFSFLFVGQTGVGKTLLVNEFSNIIYGKDNIIRIDMSEYKESHSISKIIGSPPGYVGYDSNDILVNRIKRNPYSVILLDEIEKASIEVINLFLQILDNGSIKNSKGEQIDFSNVIIFMTSNLGCNKKCIGFENNNIGFNKNDLEEFFSIEFLNRIDKILIFNNLNKNSLNKIIKNKLKELHNFYLEQGVSFSFNSKLINKIRSRSNYEIYGARKVDKIIDEEVCNLITDNIMSGNKFIDFTTIDI